MRDLGSLYATGWLKNVKIYVTNNINLNYLDQISWKYFWI